ncbi:MDR family MFS transporter [Frondihabitans australicus]|uniref:EmrB/QacA subfamily drug resistance transporter n=1 Tax=Frondihabitans australicus TaxID=386892 RepID=A0A495ICC7_9MICO|nr:MDR family MFS transporter [Frondihabitans australicus]RKR73582.1 EmrB/QacA subfamily drug resistance transporter [Frondihabitans australicus]
MSDVSAPTRAHGSSEAASRKPVMTHRQILLVIYGLMAGMFLSALDQTVVGTAIRTIGDDLHGLNQQAWVTTAYLIASTITTPIYGKLSDIFGRRPLYIFGISVFIVGSLLSSFSSSMIMLAAFRGFQGIGAGALMSLPLAIMGDILAPRERAKYQGYFLAVFGISSVIGPLIGGVFSGASQILFITGWRWVFLINVPIGIVALLMVIAFLHLPKFDKKAKPVIDWWGASLVIVTLVPLLLAAEQGRTWGWTSVGTIACFVLGGLGLIGFLIVETVMKDNAIIPLKLFRSGVFSMATLLGFLVGFAMFGAMLTIPLYLQIVTGLTPTESGFATLPMIGGLMISSIVSGQIVSRTGRYRIFPVIGTAFTAVGYVVLTFMTIDKPLWFLMIGMFFIGLGIGQLMQTITLASQNSVAPRDMGVATSSATFFRQIGGTLGTAVLLSVLFSILGGNIASATANKTDLTSALNAAMNPAVATASENKGVMKQIWTPIVSPIEKSIQANLDKATTQITSQVPAGPAQTAALQAAATKANASVIDGKLAIDYSNASQRQAVVKEVAPTIIKQINKSSGSSSATSTSDTSDTSYLNGADKRLTRPFLTGFNNSAVTIYWVGLAVILLAFVLSWFFKVPPLRKQSALQEVADGQPATAEVQTQAAIAGVEV